MIIGHAMHGVYTRILFNDQKHDIPDNDYFDGWVDGYWYDKFV